MPDTPDNTGDAPTFQESLGDHSSNELFTGMENVGGLAEKFIETNTTLAELQANQPVVPESMDDYAFDVLEGGIPYGEDNLTAIKTFAHENKWSAETFSQALKLDQEMTKQAVDTHNTKIEEAQTALKKDMGDNYEPGLQLVQKVLAKFGAEGLKERANDLASDPDIFRLVHAFGKAISPDVLEGVSGGGQGGEKKSAADTLFDGK